MNSPRLVSCGATTLIWVLAASNVMAQSPSSPPPVPEQEQPEALTSGPVHEAFAQPVNVDAQTGLTVPDQPPANIDETPPAERPAGDRYVWVPGYWAWDADRHGYIWVSGCWRVAPPSMSWVPGYWSRTDAGWQWVAGFWSPVGQQELEYQPQPPALTAEQLAASGAAPSPESIWVPPCWYWLDGRYVYRRGYWLQAQPDWLWVPASNRWTPRGYVFCPGHWDYALDHRGVLFAPVAFSGSFYGRAGFVYSPSIVLDLGVLSANLFVYPSYNHYCFGDYYDDAYARRGIFPRFEGERFHNCYDPIYAHDRWEHHRSDPRWEEEQRHDFESRRDNRDLRPPHTYHEMQARLTQAPAPQRSALRMAQPLTTVAANKAAPIKFEQASPEARQRIATQANESRKFTQQRTQWEAKPAAPSATPAEHRGTAEPSQGRHEPAAAPPSDARPAPSAAPEHREPAASPAEPRTGAPAPTPAHREPASPSAESRPPAPPPDRRAPVAPSAEPRGAAPPPPDHREPAASSAEPRGTAAPAAEHHAPAAAPAEPRSPSPSEHAAPSERVKIPSSPMARPAGAPEEKGPPARPADERQSSDTATEGKHRGN